MPIHEAQTPFGALYNTTLVEHVINKNEEPFWPWVDQIILVYFSQTLNLDKKMHWTELFHLH